MEILIYLVFVVAVLLMILSMTSAWRSVETRWDRVMMTLLTLYVLACICLATWVILTAPPS